MASRIDKFEDLAKVFHSLGNETRLAIMVLLADGEMNVVTLQKKLKLQQSNVSCHLGMLRRGGLVEARRQGKAIFYSHADLSKHRLAAKPELSKARTNAARFGPAELFLPKK